MKPELISIKENVIVIGTELENIGDGIIGVQKASLSTVSSILLGALIVVSGGVEGVADKVDEVTDSIK